MDPLAFSLDVDFSPVVGNTPVNPSLPRRYLLSPVPDEPDCYTLAIDNSSLELFSVCSRMAEYHLVAGREPASPSSALSFGSALHKGLEIIYRHGQTDDTIRLAQETIIRHFHDHPVAPDEYRTAAFCLDVFNGYIARHAKELFQVVEDEQGPWAERSFRLPLGMVELNKRVPGQAGRLITPYSLGEANDPNIWSPDETEYGVYIKKVYILWTGRIDLVISWDSKLWVLDHKTSSRGGETFFDDFYLSQPQQGYVWALSQLLDRPIAGSVVNAFICRKPTKSGISVEYDRRRYEYSPEQLSEWEHNTLTLATDFLHHLSRGFFPMETKWCFGKYGKCKYFDVCRLPSALRPTALAMDTFRNVTWSPENPTE